MFEIISIDWSKCHDLLSVIKTRDRDQFIFEKYIVCIPAILCRKPVVVACCYHMKWSDHSISDLKIQIFFCLTRTGLQSYEICLLDDTTKLPYSWVLYPKENVPMYQHCCCDIPPSVCMYVHIGPPQVKCRLLISSIFNVMNLRHFSEMP